MIAWAGTALLLVCVLVLRRRNPSPPFPPGPSGLPLIGNARDFPTSNIARRFHDLAARYGGIVYLRVFGRRIIVLDSYEIACELLDKRSKIYSDRPESVMGKLTRLSGYNLPMIPYGPRWRHHRRIYHQTLQQKAVITDFSPRIRRVTHDLLLNLLDKPEAFSRHVAHTFVASILSVGYGIVIPADDEHYANILRDTLKIIEGVVLPGKYLVELFPILQHLPGWLPGVSFKRDASTVRAKVADAKRTLYEEGKRLTMGSENIGDTMIASMLQRIAKLEGAAAEDEEEQSAGALIGTYMAGSDTTVASFHAFFLAMAMFPQIQERAQAELDRVIGRTRLLDFGDRDSLPYINAVIRELTRWNVVAPIGLPHAVLDDDEYQGYYIPKGSVVIANIWAFSRDRNVYPDPETFNPDRFLRNGAFHTGTRDPYSYIFGFGRRVCPGRHLADASLFLACASTLHAFNISPPLDDNGCPVKLEARVDFDSIVSHPKEFECIIEPRWPGAVGLVRE